MEFLRQLFALLKRRPAPDPVIEAREAWKRAGEAYRDARDRGDTRGMHEASKALRITAHEALNAELEASRGRRVA